MKQAIFKLRVKREGTLKLQAQRRSGQLSF